MKQPHKLWSWILAKRSKTVEEMQEKEAKHKRIQFRVFSAKVIEHVLIGSTEIVDIGFSEGRTRELNVGTCSVGRHVEALSLEEEVSLHASVLVRWAHHRVPKLHAHQRTRTRTRWFYILWVWGLMSESWFFSCCCFEI